MKRAAYRGIEPIVRDQRYLPLVATFIFAKTNEFVNSPAQNPINDAKTIRQV